MLKFFKTGKEFNKLAMILNQMNLILSDLESDIEIRGVQDGDHEKLFSVAFMSVKGVDERMDKYDW